LKDLEPERDEDEDEDEDKPKQENEARSEDASISIKNSPFNYAASYWLKHAMDTPPGINSTSRSKALWELVKDFFWGNSGTVFSEWFRTFSPNSEDWHTGRHSGHTRCLYDGQDKSEVTNCLHVAASYGLLDILDWAHPEGLDFDIKNREGVTPLMYAAYIGEIDAVKAVLSKGGINVNLTSCQGSDCDGGHRYVVGTALGFAIFSRRSEIMELLLKQPGIEVDYVWHGNTALGVAIDYSYPEAIQPLVGAGAKLAMRNGDILAIPSIS
jgi:hypothetical protein